MASPATVSRCGVVHSDCKDLGWEPYVTSWLANIKDQRLQEPLKALFDKYVAKTLQYRRANCRQLVPTGELNVVTSLCCLLEALATPGNGVRTHLPAVTSHIIQSFSFSASNEKLLSFDCCCFRFLISFSTNLFYVMVEYNELLFCCDCECDDVIAGY